MEDKKKKKEDGIVKEISSETAVEVELRNRELSKKWRKRMKIKSKQH